MPQETINRQTVILKFKNGAEIAVPNVSLYGIPAVFSVTYPEGCTFWFQMCDELPSGALVYHEVSQEVAHRIWASGGVIGDE